MMWSFCLTSTRRLGAPAPRSSLTLTLSRTARTGVCLPRTGGHHILCPLDLFLPLPPAHYTHRLLFHATMETEQIQITLPDCMGGLVCAANKYTRGQCPSSAGLTMVFAHCTNGRKKQQILCFLSRLTTRSGFLDKEQWDVTIQKLFELAAGTAVIQEAWALDLQSHGASAVLNQEKLRSAQPICTLNVILALYTSAHTASNSSRSRLWRLVVSFLSICPCRRPTFNRRGSFVKYDSLVCKYLFDHPCCSHVFGSFTQVFGMETFFQTACRGFHYD